MTFIEFYERDTIENLCGCLTKVPDRVVLVGDKKKLLETHAARYTRILEERGQNTEFVCRTIPRNDMRQIIRKLTEIVDEFGDCVFDLTGGDDLYLVGAGIVFDRKKNEGVNVQMHRFNVAQNVVYDCDLDNNTVFDSVSPALTVEENIKLYGGIVVNDSRKPQYTHSWNITPGFRSDIARMWEISRDNFEEWNWQIGMYKQAENLKEPSDDPLKVTVKVSRLREVYREQGRSYYNIFRIRDELVEAGLLRDYERIDKDELSFRYKNDQIKRCLTKEGQLLEMMIYSAALDTYTDTMTGVVIDWDGVVEEENDGDYSTINEIDVMMTHGLVPVFVSCKNGDIDQEELYKLSAVANRFGGKYAKKVLVASNLENGTQFGNFFRRRAKDMGIRLVEGFTDSQGIVTERLTDMDAGEVERLVKSFWNA